MQNSAEIILIIIIKGQKRENPLKDLPRISHILNVDTDSTRTSGVTHLGPDIGRSYLRWDEYDLFLKTKFLRLNTVCWLEFTVQERNEKHFIHKSLSLTINYAPIAKRTLLFLINLKNFIYFKQDDFAGSRISAVL